MSDEELARMPYAALWLSELGAVVPEWRSARPPEPPRVPAPDDPDPRIGRAGRFGSKRGHP